MERELLLLGMLRTQAMHGYQLHELMRDHLSESIQINKATTYSLLNKMARDGWVSYIEEQAGNRPLRRVYSITEDGEATFQRLVRESLARYKPMDYLGSIALAFLEILPPIEAVGLLRQRRTAIERLLQTTQSSADDHGGSMLIIEHHVRHLVVELEWLDEVIEHIDVGETR